MTGNRRDRHRLGRGGFRRLLAAAVTALTVIAVAGCSTHTESVQNPCPEVSRRGAVALAKLGLTPQELKQQGKC
jgi:hypothetical protein